MQVVKGFAKAKDYENGTPLEHRRDGTSDHHITCQDIIYESHQEDIVDIELDVGGICCFNNNVPHGTGPNMTDNPRAAVAFHFVNMKHFKERAFPLPEGAEYITPIVCGPSCSDGQKEYGHCVGEGQWLKDMQIMLDEEQSLLQEQSDAVNVRIIRQDKEV